MLRTDDNRTAWVSDVRFRSGTVAIFNFEVAGLHNYFVEELAGVGVLVHNAPGCFDEAVAAAQDAVASKGAPSTTRVGRWMSGAEHKKMVDSGFVQESFSGTTHVGMPASPGAFGKQAPPGSLYVEFDVPRASLKQTQEGWAKVLGPNTIEARLAEKKGLPIPQMPEATNIQHVTDKVP